MSGIQTNPKNNTIAIPPFVVASLNINSVSDPNSKKDTIISACAVVNRVFKIQSSATEGLFQEFFCRKSLIFNYHDYNLMVLHFNLAH